jgi:hypothetical protein
VTDRGPCCKQLLQIPGISSPLVMLLLLRTPVFLSPLRACVTLVSAASGKLWGTHQPCVLYCKPVSYPSLLFGHDGLSYVTTLLPSTSEAGINHSSEAMEISSRGDSGCTVCPSSSVTSRDIIFCTTGFIPFQELNERIVFLTIFISSYKFVRATIIFEWLSFYKDSYLNNGIDCGLMKS